MDKKIMLTSLIIALSIMSSKSVITNEEITELKKGNSNSSSIEVYNESHKEIDDPGDYDPK